MQLLFVSSGQFPFPTGNGRSVLMHGQVTCFLKLGYKITIVSLALRRCRLDKMTAYWKDRGVAVKLFPTLSKSKEPNGKLGFLRCAAFPRGQASGCVGS